MSEHEEDEPPKPTGPSVRLRFRKTLTKLKITQQVTSKMKKKSTVKKPNPRDGLGQRVALMEDGRSFGELALLNSDNKREASCVAETDVSTAYYAMLCYVTCCHQQLSLIINHSLHHPCRMLWTVFIIIYQTIWCYIKSSIYTTQIQKRKHITVFIYGKKLIEWHKLPFTMLLALF